MIKVLVVDDSATMRKMVIASLSAIGDVAFEQAVSGLDAIERLTVSVIDLVVLDLNMPDVHGLEVLRFIRGQQTLEMRQRFRVLTERKAGVSRQPARV